jgi:phosphodiesterase/alkaline phosphatase D-like protein
MKVKVAVLVVSLVVIFVLITGKAGRTQSSQSTQPVAITQEPRVEHVAVATTVIAWSTNAESPTVVHYGINANDLTQEARGGNSSGTHRVTLSDLRPGTTYYFSVESGAAKSGVKTFTTKAPAGVEPPNESSGDTRILVGPVPQQVSENSAAIWWVAAARNKSQLSYGTTQDQLNKPASEDASSPKDRHHAVLTGLEPDTTYYYAVQDANGKPVVHAQFTTEPENYKDNGRVWLIDGPVIEYLDSSSAVVAWSTNMNASTLVRYGQDANILNQNGQEKWGQETHRVTLKDLKPDSVYYFVVESGQGQGSGTMAKSNVGQFRTLKQGEQALRNLVVAPHS